MISIIIPIKNEPYIQTLVDLINSKMDMHGYYAKDYEILLVDASDKIGRVYGARTLVQCGKGLGRAILEGLQVCDATKDHDTIVTMDGDGSHQPRDLITMLNVLHNSESDIVIGSKYCSGGESHDSWFRHLISKTACRIASWTLGIQINDSMTGFSATKRRIWDTTKLNPSGFKIITELLYKNRGGLIKEVPINFLPRQAGKSKFGLKEFLRTGTFVLKLRLRTLRWF